MADKRTKVISFNDRLIEMAEEIMAQKGYDSFSALVRQGIMDMHKAIFPAYANVPRPKREEGMSPAEKQDRYRAKRVAELQESQINLCTIDLEGQVIEHESGKFCKYYTYSFDKRFEQKIPLEQLTESLIKAQYAPSKDKVLAIRAEGKAKYPVTKVEGDKVVTEDLSEALNK